MSTGLLKWGVWVTTSWTLKKIPKASTLSFGLGCCMFEQRLPDSLENFMCRINHLRSILYLSLQEIYQQTKIHLWFMHDGSQPHSVLAVRRFLNDSFPEHLVGTCGQRAWPAFSRVLSLERRLKSAVYGTEVNTVQHFQQWIQNGSETCRTTPGISQQVKQSLPKCSTSRWASIMRSISAHLYNETLNIITSTCTN